MRPNAHPLPVLTEPQTAALEALAALPEIWPTVVAAAAKLAAASESRPVASLDELVEVGAVERWDRPDGAAVVLATEAAWRLGMVPEEECERREVVRRNRKGELRFAKVRVSTDVPRWTRGQVDAQSRDGRVTLDVHHQVAKKRIGEGKRLVERPVVIPRNGHEIPIPFLVPRPKPTQRGTKQYRSKDWDDAEPTTDTAKAARLFRGGSDTVAADGRQLLGGIGREGAAPGIPVELDLKGSGRRNRLVDVARRAMREGEKSRKRPGAG
jgi:hypothetical protein